MPFYDYKCTECGHFVKDFNKRITEDHPTTCPKCGKEGLLQSYEGHKPHVELKGDWHEASGKRGRF